MTLITALTPALKAHWLVHLNATDKDLPSLRQEIRNYVLGTSQLPNIKQPSYIHDWLEYPKLRAKIEAWNG